MGSSIDTARAAWSSQRQDETTSQREAARAIVRSGVTTLGGIAKALQAQGVKTPSGASKWHRAQVSRLLAGDAAAPAERLANVSMPDAPQTLTNLNRPPPGTGSAANTTAPVDAVAVEITADHVFLPTGEDGNIGLGWESAADTERVKHGRRLMVPRAIADSLQGRRQAVILPDGASIPVYFRPGTPGYRP
jgi:hypothetical protein